MTEAEWLAGENLDRLMHFACDSHLSALGLPPPVGIEHFGDEARAFPRKRRLFACACCRRIWELIPQNGRMAVEAAEGFADGVKSDEQRETAWRVAHDSSRGITRAAHATMAAAYAADEYRDDALVFSCSDFDGGFTATAWQIMHAIEGSDTSEEAAWEALLAGPITIAGRSRDELSPAQRLERVAQIHLFRDIFGNPFRPVAIDPAWRAWNDATVVKLAQQMYDSRDFTSMPILADALEEVGCTSGDILEHCRGPGPHMRGCWVVDLVLGKE